MGLIHLAKRIDLRFITNKSKVNKKFVGGPKFLHFCSWFRPCGAGGINAARGYLA